MAAGMRNPWPHDRAIRSIDLGGFVSRDDLVPLNGRVSEVLAGGNFRIALENGGTVLAQLSGRLRRNRIRVTLGDHVTVSVSPYDPSRGLITYRH